MKGAEGQVKAGVRRMPERGWQGGPGGQGRDKLQHSCEWKVPGTWAAQVPKPAFPPAADTDSTSLGGQVFQISASLVFREGLLEPCRALSSLVTMHTGCLVLLLTSRVCSLLKGAVLKDVVGCTW